MAAQPNSSEHVTVGERITPSRSAEPALRLADVDAVEGPGAARLGHYEVSKRLMDIVLSSAVLVVAAPLLVAIAVAVRFGSPGPALFSQVRIGRSGRQFRCLKYRSMIDGAESVLEDLLTEVPEYRAEFARGHKLRGDPRITALGHVLRRTSLDELPQFWNVLRGDMSIVGPRPVVPTEIARYGETASTVLGVKPGITGVWQVSGRNQLDYSARIAMDLDYVRSRRLSTDLSVMLRTVGVVFRGSASGAC